MQTAHEVLKSLSFRIANSLVAARDRYVRDGNPINHAAIGERFEELADQAGVEGFQLAELRQRLVPAAISKILDARAKSDRIAA